MFFPVAAAVRMSINGFSETHHGSAIASVGPSIGASLRWDEDPGFWSVQLSLDVGLFRVCLLPEVTVDTTVVLQELAGTHGGGARAQTLEDGLFPRLV